MNLSALVPQNVTSSTATAATLSREGLRVRSGVRAGIAYMPPPNRSVGVLAAPVR